MKDGPNIAGIAALIGDRARSEILTALLGGQALTATELGGVADVTKQTVSSHLARLLEAKLVTVEQQGRHRYFRLADDDVAQLLESLLGVAYRTGAARASWISLRAASANSCGCFLEGQRPDSRRLRGACLRTVRSADWAQTFREGPPDELLGYRIPAGQRRKDGSGDRQGTASADRG